MADREPIKTDGGYQGALNVGESVAFNIFEDGTQRTVARQTGGVWRIEADGVSVIDCGTFDYTKPEAFGECRPGLDIRRLIKPAKYRVLLERIE